MSHLCTYEEPAWAAYETQTNILGGQHGSNSQPSSSATNSPAPRSPFTFKPTATATAQIQQHQQQELQYQQQQFQQSLLQQQQYQQTLQHQIAAKYGSNGKPLTGAATTAGSAGNSPYVYAYGAAPDRRTPVPPQYYGVEHAGVLLPPIANQTYNSTNSNNNPNLMSELEYLKNRIVQIEGSMGDNGYHHIQQQPQVHQPQNQYYSHPQHQLPQYPPQQQHQLQQQQQQQHQQQQEQQQEQQQHQQQQSQPQQQPHQAHTPYGFNNSIQLPSINQIKPLFDSRKDKSHESKPQLEQKENINEIKSNEDEENIDPTLIDDSEIITSFKTNTPNAKYLNHESSGIFETVSFAKKDDFQTNFFLCLQAHDEKLKAEKENDESGPMRKRLKLNDHFHNLLQNPRYQVETFFKYETNNLTEIIKMISKLLPYKKIVWLLVEKFFTSFADPFIPVLNEEEFLLDITKIIGEKELNDSRIKITADVNNSRDLVNLTYLLMILRISTVSLSNTIKLDKFNNFLLKNAPVSSEFDFIIDIMLIILQNFSIDKMTRLKLKLLELFLFNKAGEASDVSDFYPAGLAISLNLNNKSEIGSNEQFIKIWYHLYFQYYNVNIVKGIPIFLNDDFFNLELSNFKNGNLGVNFHKSIMDFYGKQIELNKIIFKIWNKLYNFINQEVTVGGLEKLIETYDQFVLSNFKDYDTYKKEVTSNYSNKCLTLINNANHKLTKMNLNCFILIHYENEERKDKEKFLKLLRNVFTLCIESVEKSFDILKNYNSHFNAGYEFIVFPSLISLLDKASKLLIAMALRLWWAKRPSLAIFKFLVNMVDELQGFTFLDNYFACWKIKMKTLMFVDLSRDAYLKKEGAMPLLSETLKLPNVKEEIKFDHLYTNYQAFDESEMEEIEKLLDLLNRKFDNKYANVTTLDEFFTSLDIEKPIFDIKYFF